MSILINKDTKVITQGITGKTGQFHTRMCRDYANGKNCFVAGVNPKKAGENFEDIPIYATVTAAGVSATSATVTIVYAAGIPGVSDGDNLVYTGTCAAGSGLTWSIAGTVPARLQPKI